MRRILSLVFLALLAWLACSGFALAQDGIYSRSLSIKPGGANFPYGSGFYYSWWKLPLFWMLFLLWVRTMDWINQDGQRLKLEYRKWNMIAFFSFVAPILLLWLLPLQAAFFIAFPLMAIAYVVPFWLYVSHRNAGQMDVEKVFTKPHLRFWLSRKLKTVGINMQSETKEEGPPVEFQARGGKSERDDSVALLTAKQSPGFMLARELLHGALEQRAEGILLDYTQQATAVRHQVDGVWLNVDSRDRESSDMMLAVLKTISALNASERRARQQGNFITIHKAKQKITCGITSQGTKTGERVLIQLQSDKQKEGKRLPEMGMRDKMQEELKALLEQKHGVMIVSAPPGGGLSTLMFATATAMDRYIRSFSGIEDEVHREFQVENVIVKTFKGAEGQTPASVMQQLLLEYPDGFVVPDLTDEASAAILLEQAADDRLLLTSVHAKEASEALLRMLALNINAEQFAGCVLGVVNQRLIRKLCTKCKEAYAPPPQLLQQLGLPADRIEAFYRPPQPPAEGQKEQEICQDCRGLGYKGRTGIFELLVVNDLVRKTLVSNPQLDALRNAARRAGMRTLQEEGLVLVAKGVTSLPELMRVLKE